MSELPLKTVNLIVGYMLGASEYVAEALENLLQSKGYQTQLHLQPSFSEIPQTGIWIICSSTHGAGDLPDNIQAFSQSLNSAQLPDVQFMLVALGDSSYDTFCQAGKTLYQQMRQSGARALADIYCIDVLEHPIPEEVAQLWLTELFEAGKIAQR